MTSRYKEIDHAEVAESTTCHARNPLISMHIRRYKTSDLVQCNDIIEKTSQNDTLTHFLRKDIERYPISYWRNGLLYVRSLFAEKGAQCFVMVADSTDGQDYIERNNEILALAVFTRHGNSEVAKKWQNSTNNNLTDSFERQCASLTMKYHQLFPSTMPTSNNQNRRKIQSIMEADYDREIFSEAWEVSACYTHIPWQRRGIAGQMLNWIKAVATAEGVPVVVKSSPIGVRAYKRHGFRSIRAEGFYEFFDEVRLGGEKHQELVWEPEGHEGEWFEPAKAKAEQEKTADA